MKLAVKTLENKDAGEITLDKGREEKVENTKYKGIHQVECYIVKNDKCVAITKIQVPIQQ